MPPEPRREPPRRAYDGKFAGRLELRYATADEATRAGRALAAGAFPIELEHAFASALAKLPQTIEGTTLVVRFDETRFPDVELDKLQAWLARAQAAATQP